MAVYNSEQTRALTNIGYPQTKHEIIIVTIKLGCKPRSYKLNVMLFPYMVRKGAIIKFYPR